MASFVFPKLSWLRSPSQRRRPHPARARIGLEELEGRSLPSAVTPAVSAPEHHGQVEVHHPGKIEVHHHGRHGHGRSDGGTQHGAATTPTAPGSAGSPAPSADDSPGQQHGGPHDVQAPSAPAGGGTYYGGGAGSDGGNHGSGRDGGGEDQHGATGGDEEVGNARIEARLSGASGATGRAEFDATAKTFEVDVAGAAPNATLNVVVDNNSVGTISTDAQGDGRLELSQPSFTPQDGSTITVGDVANGGLGGTFHADAELKASLAPLASPGGSGTAEFEQGRQRLEIRVFGLAANVTVNVSVDQTIVGQLTTDSRGQGELRLNNPSVTVKAGSVVTVGDLSNPVLQGMLSTSGGEE